MPFTFLSDEWLAEATKLRDEVGAASGGPADLTLNMVVTGGPEGDRELHLAGGAFALGHVPDAPTKMTVPFDVARQVFVEGNQQAAMQAFMAGHIKVEGDMTKLMAMQASGGSPEQQELGRRLREITA